MTLRLRRRAVLLLPMLLAACGDDEETPAPASGGDFPPLRYGYLPPIKLNVERMETAKGYVPPTGDDEMIGYSPVDPAETLFAMARDRLKPVGQGGVATFKILTASIVRHHDTLDGVLAVRLDVHNADDTSTGYVEARVTATHTGPVDDRRAVVYDMLKSMMFEMNVELEYQLRNKLKSWVVDTQAEPAPESAAPRPPAAQPPAAPEVGPPPEAPTPPVPPEDLPIPPRPPS